jgi:hypothetical protein
MNGISGIESAVPFGTGWVLARSYPTLKGWAIVVAPFGRPTPPKQQRVNESREAGVWEIVGIPVLRGNPSGITRPQAQRWVADFGPHPGGMIRE